MSLEKPGYNPEEEAKSMEEHEKLEEQIDAEATLADKMVKKEKDKFLHGEPLKGLTDEEIEKALEPLKEVEGEEMEVIDKMIEGSEDVTRDELEAELQKKYGIDPEKVAVSGRKKFKLGMRSLFNPELRKTWRLYQASLKDEETKNIAERPANMTERIPKKGRETPNRDTDIKGPNRFNV